MTLVVPAPAMTEEKSVVYGDKTFRLQTTASGKLAMFLPPDMSEDDVEIKSDKLKSGAVSEEYPDLVWLGQLTNTNHAILARSKVFTARCLESRATMNAINIGGLKFGLPSEESGRLIVLANDPSKSDGENWLNRARRLLDIFGNVELQGSWILLGDYCSVTNCYYLNGSIHFGESFGALKQCSAMDRGLCLPIAEVIDKEFAQYRFKNR